MQLYYLDPRRKMMAEEAYSQSDINQSSLESSLGSSDSLVMVSIATKQKRHQPRGFRKGVRPRLTCLKAPEMKAGASPSLSVMTEVQVSWRHDGFGLAAPSQSLFTIST